MAPLPRRRHLLPYTFELPFSLAASSLDSLRKARQLHALLLVSSPLSSTFVYNNLLSLYAKCGALADARKVFDAMPVRRSAVSYNAVIAAHSRDPRGAPLALRLFRDMARAGLSPTASTLASVVRASASLKDPFFGSIVHTRVIISGLLDNVCVQTALLGMYAEFGSVGSARRVFDEMGVRDVIAWNCIIHCYVKNGYAKQGLELLCRMRRTGLAPTQSTFSIALHGCAKAEDWNGGRMVHAQMIKSDMEPDLPVHNALLDMYASCADITAALCVFEGIEEPDLVSWNSLIAGYSDVGDGEKAMHAFIQLRVASLYGGPDPDEYTFSAVVSAVATFRAIYYGRPLHAQVVKAGFEYSIYVGNTLINMYFMNEEPNLARMLFNSMHEKDVIIWTEMIVGHSTLGEGELALTYFYDMLKEGHKVDSFSLSSALNSSADLAVLRQGEMLHSQVIKAGYGANMCVSGSLVDMYAKNGYLESAFAVFTSVHHPDLKCWNSIIGGYGNHGNTAEAFKLLSMWDNVAEMRNRIRGMMLEKEPGLSWIELKNMVHVFSADDETHPHAEDCRSELLRLQRNLKRSEVPELQLVCSH
ncbi:Pentatricopeptide repeat-containing protein [Ananas comosus]|uniref:Pentatricopeptide repeat-containing protein n=1 Tax=Ananas comosus TaxID=4615 RepID=A0A199W3J7_ANACO|nr:Pentatricopeptide repeat-containing protein [Ananas comosus]